MINNLCYFAFSLAFNESHTVTSNKRGRRVKHVHTTVQLDMLLSRTISTNRSKFVGRAIGSSDSSEASRCVYRAYGEHRITYPIDADAQVSYEFRYVYCQRPRLLDGKIKKVKTQF